MNPSLRPGGSDPGQKEGRPAEVIVSASFNTLPGSVSRPGLFSQPAPEFRTPLRFGPPRAVADSRVRDNESAQIPSALFLHGVDIGLPAHRDAVDRQSAFLPAHIRSPRVEDHSTMGEFDRVQEAFASEANE